MSVQVLSSSGTAQSGGKWMRTEIRGNPPLLGYFGSGADGSVTYAASTNLTSTLDGPAVVMNFVNLIINAGVTVTTSNRCRGLIVYVQGDCTINGTLTMSGKGCAGTGQNIGVFRPGSAWADAPMERGVGTTIAAVGASAGLAGTFGRSGGGGQGAGGGAPSAGTSWGGGSGSGGAGGQGSAGGAGGANGGTGGAGGNGGADYGGNGGGGSGGGIIVVMYAGTLTGTLNATANGGAGGAAGTTDYNNPHGGGGGGGGAGGAGGAGGTGFGAGGAGGAGSGGLLCLIVGGNLTIGASSMISANGSAGGGGGYGKWGPGIAGGAGGAGSIHGPLAVLK